MEALLTSSDSLVLEVSDASQVSAARLALQRMSRPLELDETRAGRLAIVATEAATNLLRHGGGGVLIARTLRQNDGAGVELLAIDRGCGMEDFEHSARDGVSGAGSAGTGLGAIRRLSDEFEAFTRPGNGTVLRIVVWKARPQPGDWEFGAVSVARNGESVCGDAWGILQAPEGITVVVADGLGHGPDARRAASTAVEVLHGQSGRPLPGLIDLAHARLRATRGAAIAFARQAAGRDDLSYAGVGNISATIWMNGSRRSLVSHNGIVGHNMYKSAEFGYAWPVGALLVMHSDGLETRWDLSGDPALARAHPSIIAAALFRAHWRKRDDVTVVVGRRIH